MTSSASVGAPAKILTSGSGGAPHRSRGRRTHPNVLGGFGSVIWLAIVVIPLYWIVITSFRTQSGFFSENPLIPPAEPTLANYQLVLENDFWRYLLNSLIVTGVAVALILVVGFLFAYTIARTTNKKTRALFNVMLIGLAIPLQATIIPVYLMIVKARLYDNLIAIILPSVAFALPITVLILVNFLRDIPNSLYEAALIDGATEWQIIRRLAFPLAKPAIVTVAIYNGLNVWNGFLFPLILTQSPEIRVLPLALTSYQGLFSINVPAVLAAVVLSSLPIIALYVVGRRQLVAGMTAGFGK
ncbi:raffinose/stachyose/melibiose transport system permease protein [Tessaracoccus bendigoensis DSM 12906]|uniref:Raffinose/stachyose/melibiose transport system permease protein n=1 Tax=Tessaracoccus bendigoensis DSM 12906 TaxID=1123357 RepID=A0A1M6C8D1_9ACTN|nr:carbohydrate ABC transporter permease [Tessaracoccus bendigoensis]SHI57008.1 raffinose/stachyose/melibiose transport system permease protein [Tessaracoccus bendigoensis DSM 12906]